MDKVKLPQQQGKRLIQQRYLLNTLLFNNAFGQLYLASDKQAATPTQQVLIHLLPSVGLGNGLLATNCTRLQRLAEPLMGLPILNVLDCGRVDGQIYVVLTAPQTWSVTSLPPPTGKQLSGIHQKAVNLNQFIEQAGLIQTPLEPSWFVVTPEGAVYVLGTALSPVLRQIVVNGPYQSLAEPTKQIALFKGRPSWLAWSLIGLAAVGSASVYYTYQITQPTPSSANRQPINSVEEQNTTSVANTPLPIPELSQSPTSLSVSPIEDQAPASEPALQAITVADTAGNSSEPPALAQSVELEATEQPMEVEKEPSIDMDANSTVPVSPTATLPLTEPKPLALSALTANEGANIAKQGSVPEIVVPPVQPDPILRHTLPQPAEPIIINPPPKPEKVSAEVARQPLDTPSVTVPTRNDKKTSEKKATVVTVASLTPPIEKKVVVEQPKLVEPVQPVSAELPPLPTPRPTVAPIAEPSPAPVQVIPEPAQVSQRPASAPVKPIRPAAPPARKAAPAASNLTEADIIHQAQTALQRGQLNEVTGQGAIYFIRLLQQRDSLSPQISRLAREVVQQHQQKARKALAEGDQRVAGQQLWLASRVIKEFNLVAMNASQQVLEHKLAKEITSTP